jgi:hypothetical protein
MKVKYLCVVAILLARCFQSGLLYRNRSKKWRIPVKKLMILASFLIAALVPAIPAMAQDSSPYVIGHWKFADSFQDFTPGTPLVTDNTDFSFLNPTDLTLTLEYAFFAPDGTFCGCDRDTLKPNGRTRYTMLGEKKGGQFSTTLCPTQTEGELKSIVFTGVDSRTGEDQPKNAIEIGDAVQGGVQIHIFGGNRSESNMQGVTINKTTLREMNELHAKCVTFIGS